MIEERSSAVALEVDISGESHGDALAGGDQSFDDGRADRRIFGNSPADFFELSPY